MIEMVCLVNYFFVIWQWCNFSGIEALEFSCIYTCVSLRPQTYFQSSLTHVLNQFRNKQQVSTLIKKEVKNLYQVNPVPCRIIRLLISLSNLQASETESCCKSILVWFVLVFWKSKKHVRGFPIFDYDQKLQNKLEIMLKRSWMIIQKCLSTKTFYY